MTKLSHLLNLSKLFNDYSLPAIEWVGKQEGERDVFVKFDESNKRIILQTKRGDPVRRINIGNLAKFDNATIVMMITNDRKRPIMLVKIPKEYDMVHFNNFFK